MAQVRGLFGWEAVQGEKEGEVFNHRTSGMGSPLPGDDVYHAWAQGGPPAHHTLMLRTTPQT